MDNVDHVECGIASQELADETNSGFANLTDQVSYGAGSPGPSSRKRKPFEEPSQRRKRAATACHFCRLRKTKCDNVRPVCGFCRFHLAKCVYSDMPSSLEGHFLGERSDLQHRQLLSRLDRIENLLLHPAEPPNASVGDLELSNSANAISTEVVPSQTRIFFSSSTRCEAPLKWPIFYDFLNEKYTRINSFLLEPPIPEPSDPPRSTFFASPAPSSSAPYSEARSVVTSIRNEDLVPLCRKFLAQVHTKNPVLEGSDLIGYAADCAESGLKLDAPSCLVVRRSCPTSVSPLLDLSLTLMSTLCSCSPAPWRVLLTHGLRLTIAPLHPAAFLCRSWIPKPQQELTSRQSTSSRRESELACWNCPCSMSSAFSLPLSTRNWPFVH
jgi:hypothetical protein